MTLRGRAWIPIGPSPISKDIVINGLVSAIAINPSNPDIIYMGTGGGGMWRSMDGGVTWTPLFDRQLTLGVGGPSALAIDPDNTNIVYLGGSNRVSKSTPVTRLIRGQTGLFKSIDGGYGWIRVGSGYPLGNTGNAKQFFTQNINVIIVDPANSTTLYLASDVGLFRSTDRGLNWTQGRIPTGNLVGDARSLALDTSATGSRILYTGISGNGVFRSNDGGLNWARILDRNTPAVQAALGMDSFGKVLVDIAPPISPPNPVGVQIIYVSLERANPNKNDPVGIFISTDQGATWSQQTGTNLPNNCQGGYSFHMAVDPSSPGDGINDIIYIGCVGQCRSDDSGNTFTKINPGAHSDTHAWTFVRQPSPTPSIVYNGNDGGLVKSTDRGTTWTPLNSGGLQTGLFYNIDLRPNTPGIGVKVGALQDNGIYTTSTAVGEEWKGNHGGDGWDVVYDGQIAGQVYCTDGVYGPPATRVFRSTNDGLTFSTDITPWDTTTDAGMYLAVIATDPNTGGTVYVSGSQNLWQSFDGGNTWRIITPLTVPPLTGSCDSVDVARGNGNHVVIAVDDQVAVSTNALAATVGPPTGVTFTNIKRNLPNRFVTRVAFDPNDPTTIYAVLGGFGTGHVFRTSIGASSWTDISPNIDAPFGAIALQGGIFPTPIYVGTEFGVLRSVDGGSSWSVLDDIHFPRVPVFDLELKSGLLVAGTYGRGAFAFFNNLGDPVIAVNIENNLAFDSVRQGPVYLTLQIFNVGDPGRGGVIVRDLVIESVQRLMGSTSFSVLHTPGTPLVVRAGEHVDFTVEYNPTGAGVEEIATIRIISNDPTAPVVDLSASGLQAAYD